MLHLETGLSRRGFLAGSVSLGAFMLPRTATSPLAAEPSGDKRRRARSVIVLLQEGGMSHLDSWDPKPAAPAEVRGSFQTIPTSNPDLVVSEHMPRLAGQAHLYNVVRSVYMDNARRDHSPGLHWVLTGYDNQAAGVSQETVNHAPSVGSIVAHRLGTVTPEGLPNFVSIPTSKQLGGRVRYTGALYLGAKCEPFVSGSVPDRASGGFTLPTGLTLSAGVSPARLADRSRLLASIDVAKRQCDEIAAVQELSAYQHQAIDLLLGQRGQAAFDINQEPPETREMYGDSQMGQGTLLARRLVEAGVTYILVNYSKNNSWDTHNDNFKRMKKSLLPPMDQAVTALLTDLKQRDLLDDVLVLLMGEMGRTPKINKQSGRDHWPDVFSLMIAGGGLTRGQVLGSSSSLAEVPHDRPVHYHEILATVYHQLGIDPHLMLRDRQQRPIRILHDAEPVYELIA